MSYDNTKINREDYVREFQKSCDEAFHKGGTLTLRDITEFYKGDNKEIIDSDFVRFLGSKVNNKICKILGNNSLEVSSKESEEFILDVKASNITDIAEEGYFYKKLAGALDSTFVIETSCNSKGMPFKVRDIDKDTYEFKIRHMNFRCKKGDMLNTESYEEFRRLTYEDDEIYVYNPMSCEHSKNNCYCEKCVGKINVGGRDLPTKNIGFITLLSVTEKSTQASLNSMNNGKSMGIGKAVESELTSGSGNFEDMITIIQNRIDEIGNNGVQSRWLEITLISRLRKVKDGVYKASSVKTAIKNNSDPLSCFIFSPSVRTLLELIKCEGKKIDIKSKKTQIFFDMNEGSEEDY